MFKTQKSQLLEVLTRKNEAKVELCIQKHGLPTFLRAKWAEILTFGGFALIFTSRNLQKVRSTRTSEVYTSGKIVRKKQVKVGFVYFRSPELFQSLQK